MQTILLIGAAGFVGTVARYWLSGWADERFGGRFPIGTVVVNLIGCLMIGFLFHSLEEKYLVDPVVRATILFGFLGGFTTFSSYGLQTFTLIQAGDVFMAGLNLIVSNAAGLLLVWAGYSLSRCL